MTSRIYLVLAFLAFPLAGGELTHLGVPAGDHVLLEMVAGVRTGCGPAKIDFVRTFPDGGAGAEPFRIPEDRVLVATDVDWYYFDGTPGIVQVLRLFVENLADPEKRRKVFESAAQLNGLGVGGANARMTSGFLVSSDARLCVDVTPGPLGTPLRLSKLLVRGYLVAER